MLSIENDGLVIAGIDDKRKTEYHKADTEQKLKK